MRPLVTLLTDFGTADGYVGEMKGVLLSRAPDAQLVDITHEIPPQDVEAGRLALARVWRRFPAGVVHLVVVDPGVGSARAALAVASDDRLLVGPDNGVLSPALLLSGARAVEIPVPGGVSATFHGRDVFAPTAAALAMGASLDSLGPAARAPVVRRTAEPRRTDEGTLEGEVITIDRFGNAVTNLFGWRGGSVRLHDTVLPLRRTYADVEPGEPVALAGSSGFIEIAIRDGSAARELAIQRGTQVRFTPRA